MNGVCRPDAPDLPPRLSRVRADGRAWQALRRRIVDQFDGGMVLKPAVKYRDVVHNEYPRDNH
jgi:dihydroxy-acid dehydratase